MYNGLIVFSLSEVIVYVAKLLYFMLSSYRVVFLISRYDDSRPTTSMPNLFCALNSFKHLLLVKITVQLS